MTTHGAPIIRLQDAPSDYDQGQQQQVIAALRQILMKNNRSQRNGYDLSNVTPTYSYDPTTATPAETNNLLAWIVYQLYTRGYLA